MWLHRTETYISFDFWSDLEISSNTWAYYKGERKKNKLVGIILIDNSIIVSISEIFYKKNKEKLFLSNYFEIFYV